MHTILPAKIPAIKNLAKGCSLLISILLIIRMPLQAQAFEWKTVPPETQGFSPDKLHAMLDTLKAHATEGLLVIRNDKIVLEWYAKGWSAEKPHGTASLAKALVGGMSLLLALQDGRLKPDDLAWKYIPRWKDDPLKSRITIRELATHTSGIEDAEVSVTDSNGKVTDLPHMSIPGWAGDFWRQRPDPFSIARDEASVIFEPGTDYQYSNPGMAMLSYAITSSYRDTLHTDIRTLLWERIYKPIGIKEHEWSIGYGKTFRVDGLNLVANWGGAAFTPRATARIGRLMLRKGNWEGKQLIDSSWIEQVTTYGGTPLESRNAMQSNPASAMCWYNNFDGAWPKAPRDTYLGAGANNQHLIVIPSLRLIIVRYGRDMYDPKKGEGFYYGTEKYLVNMLMDALTDPPYPKSDVIRSVRFSPVSTIIRKARGSDNWPLTWGDDDNLYTAYGDGSGFEPQMDKKLSLGLAKITGGPQDFQGANIRSETGEQTGNGRKGEKASGMLMLHGILYMWIRNADHDGRHSQLAWSADHGKTWSYSHWQFTESFGCPTFLNFGKNYRHARDKYVYIYSHDDEDAYKPADHMVLARVPENSIQQRGKYEFFKGLDEKGDPVWTKDIAEQQPVFTHPAGCYRSGISYDVGLKRYLWCQVLESGADPRGSRFQGGFGIYEAPEPWGPWRTVYYTRNWDVGPGEACTFPTKWMSRDGKTCYLVFSGDDCFSVRKATFETK